MAFADITYTGDGSTLVFNIPFSYINESHLVFYVDGVSTAAGGSLYTATIQTGGTTVQIKKTSDNSAVASGVAIKVERNTPITTPSVVFSNSSTLKATDLNTEINQLLYSAQETADDAAGKINLDATGHWGADSKKIRSMADPVDAQDAVTKNYLETTWLSPSDKTNLTAVSGKLTEIGRLGTADAVADMAIIGTADFVADMNTVASADFVSDLNTVASADFVADMNVLATADVVSDMNTLGTSANVTAMDTVAGSITNVNTTATNIASINTNATNIAAITGASTQATNAASSATASAASATAAAASAASAASNAGTQTVDRFNGTGSQTAFTMSQSPATENNTMVYISGVYQQKDTYSTSGTTLTFSSAPPTGTGNIEVMHMSTLPTGVDPEIGTVTTGAAGSSASVTATGHTLDFTIPRGDTGAQGIQGIQGIQGNVGTAATIAVGSTTTGAAGSSAAVTNSGSSSAATFDFTVPRGDTGATGPQGIQGIQGDTGPAGSLSGASDGTAAAPSISFSADTNTGLFRPASDKIGFTTGGTSAMTISGSNVGIGRTSPTYDLEVDGVAALYASSTETRNFEVGYGRTGNGFSYVDLIGDATYTDYGLRLIRGNTGPNTSSELTHRGTGPLVLTAFDAGYIDLRTANTNRIRVTGTGLVGINTQTPTRHLTVNGSIQMASGGVIEAGTTALNTYIAGVQGASGRWAFATNGSEKMRITSDGRLGLGTSAPSGILDLSAATGSGTLNIISTVNATNAGNKIAFFAAGRSDTDEEMAFIKPLLTSNSGGSGNVQAGHLTFGTVGSERMRITSSGNVGIGVSPSYKLHVSGDIYATGNVTAYSSAVAKDEITTIPDALDLVEQLRGVSFKWKESGKKAVGLIYEEVKEVIPELTSEKEGHVGVAYQNTVALLIEAVKTLSAKVKELESK